MSNFILTHRQERARADDLWPVFKSPLGERAWTLQEAILSTRVIHFAEDQLYWECASKRCSEDGALDTMHDRSYLAKYPGDDIPMPFTMFQNSSPSDGVHANWLSMAIAYSRRKITYHSDKVPALAGTTTFTQ